MMNDKPSEKIDSSKAKKEFDTSVELIRASYRFFCSRLPQSKQFTPGRPLRIGDFEFASKRQAHAMLVELGWAFFMRLDAAFDAFISRLKLDKKKAMEILHFDSGFNENEKKGFNEARDLRNILQHGDGDADLLSRPPKYVNHEPGNEPQLDPEHIEQFIVLFEKAANVLGKEKDGECLH